MTACERLSERIPDVKQGRSRLTAEETAHLAACAECAAEWRLLGAVHAIGAAAPVPGDATRLTAGVLRRLAEDRRIRLRSWRGRLVGAGVAAAIATALWTAVQGGAPAPESPLPPVEIALPELEPLETAELDSLLETMDSTPAAWSALGEPTLGDLDADELEQVLGTWEG